MAHVEVFCDGAARGQGGRNKKNGKKMTYGEASCACVIYINRKVEGQFARPLGKKTNNEAEYEAVINALLMCSNANLDDPIIYSDSAVVVNQVAGRWRCNSPKLFPLLQTIKHIEKDFHFRLQQLPRNKAVAKGIGIFVADALAKECLDQLEEEQQKLLGNLPPTE